MLRPNSVKYSLFSFIYIFCLQIPCGAQLKADFIMDRSGGCAPLTVFFTNTSSGTSPSAVYEWDFGNANGSSLKNAGAVFLDQKDYTVTLTVRDGNQTASKTQTVTVYQKPVVDFSVSSAKVCTPDPVTFTSKAKADKGNIVDYMWDFGDGFTGRSYGSEITHTYLIKQKSSVTLSVTDNHGCSNSKTIDNIVEVIPGVSASFSADKTFICFAPDPVTMINSSTSGEGALSYTWDFGDGITSSAKDPTHSFNKKGIYSVKLSIQSTTGCKSELTKTAYLNVGEFKSQMNVPDVACQNSAVTLQNTSMPAPTSYSWLIDGASYPYYYNSYTFSTAGEHTIQLTNNFGTCVETISKKIRVNELPQPKGFVTQIPDYCFPPVTVSFKDTTTGAVKSEWNFENYYYPLPIQATGKSVSFRFDQAYTRNVTLFVTDANGCKNSVQQPVAITQPYVYIQTIDFNGMYGCEKLTKKFSFVANEPLASFKWDFGDGSTSVEAEPEHTFTKSSLVKLTYTTAKGCSSESSYININISQKPKADFVSLSGTTICGNSFIQFEKKTNTSVWDYFLVNGEYTGIGSYSNFTYQFKDTGKHTITHIAYNEGCSDTMTRVDYITVLPSFPKISGFKNTCDGDRGTVTFTQNSRYAKKWMWDFGDGTTASYNTDEPEITHHYTKSGEYKVVLTTNNGQCSNRDSMAIRVLLKQQPILSSSKTSICADETLKYTITNLDIRTFSSYYFSHQLESYQYNDGTTFPLDYYYNYWINLMPFNSTIGNVQKGKDSIRIVTREGYFGCLDTTNYIPIKVTGAAAGFEIVTNNVCFKSPVSFKDTSKAQNTTIVSRQWDFGDGQTQAVTQGGVITHLYANPGTYYVTLRITDASGCTSTTSSYTQMVSVNGPKANFSPSETNAHLNSTIYFYNNTNNYNSYNTKYEWQFGDGTTSGEYYPSYTYTQPGNYKIRLIAKNPDTGCSDTAYSEITVKNFNANFSFTSSFVNSAECGPTLVRFSNTSYDYTHVKWDFGDGFTSDNINYPSHIYTAPGKYIIKLFVTGNNGLSKTYVDSVVIKSNKVNISANKLYACTSQSVTLSAVSENVSSYLWDFGDGTIVQASDTFSVHYYQRPGIYIPKLISKDGDGCAASITLSEKITIDSLYLSLNNLEPKICTPKEILFNPTMVNTFANQAFTYHWDFGTGNKADTSNIKTPAFVYQQPGNYSVSLKVQSEYGCAKEVKANIAALQGLGGRINGPVEICQESTAQFTGSTQLPGQPKWRWIFDDGTIVDQQNPPAKKYNNAGSFLVKLIVDNSGCIDTVSRVLEVHAKPVVNLSSRQETICEGASVSITAGGGTSYAWSPSAGLSNTTGASIIANPASNTTYVVTATNAFKCVNSDSVKISVIHPFKLQLPAEAFVCRGESIRLNAAGANAYHWILNTEGLSNTSVSNPVASPNNTTIYTVTGTGEKGCFSDTAEIKIVVHERPSVNAGAGAEILVGSPYQLQSSASNDVISWSWSPSDFLSCINCAAPLATPLKPMDYIITVKNSHGCAATDTVTIKLICSESQVFIPTGFTPNNDGLNDQFSILGQGISKVNNLRIYDRWGTLMFERSNFSIGDKSAAWDGRYKGVQVPLGLYTYFVEMSCSGNTFTRKGTVTVIY